METVILTVHLILALFLIVIVLLQKNEGAALLSGGGNTQARGKATTLTKLTWLLAIAFIATSLALTIMATRDSGGSSVVDTISGGAPSSDEEPADQSPLLPPPVNENGTGTAPASSDPTLPPVDENNSPAP